VKVSLLNRLNMEQIQQEINIFQKKSDPKSLLNRYLGKHIGDYQNCQIDFENIERNTKSYSFIGIKNSEKIVKIARNNKKNETISSKKIDIMKEMMPETVMFEKKENKTKNIGKRTKFHRFSMIVSTDHEQEVAKTNQQSENLAAITEENAESKNLMQFKIKETDNFPIENLENNKINLINPVKPIEDSINSYDNYSENVITADNPIKLHNEPRNSLMKSPLKIENPLPIIEKSPLQPKEKHLLKRFSEDLGLNPKKIVQKYARTSLFLDSSTSSKLKEKNTIINSRIQMPKLHQKTRSLTKLSNFSKMSLLPISQISEIKTERKSIFQKNNKVNEISPEKNLEDSAEILQKSTNELQKNNIIKEKTQQIRKKPIVKPEDLKIPQLKNLRKKSKEIQKKKAITQEKIMNKSINRGKSIASSESLASNSQIKKKNPFNNEKISPQMKEILDLNAFRMKDTGNLNKNSILLATPNIFEINTKNDLNSSNKISLNSSFNSEIQVKNTVEIAKVIKKLIIAKEISDTKSISNQSFHVSFDNFDKITTSPFLNTNLLSPKNLLQLKTTLESRKRVPFWEEEDNNLKQNIVPMNIIEKKCIISQQNFVQKEEKVQSIQNSFNLFGFTNEAININSLKEKPKVSDVSPLLKAGKKEKDEGFVKEIIESPEQINEEEIKISPVLLKKKEKKRKDSK